MLGSELKIITRPNCSLTTGGQKKVFAVIAGFALLVAFGFTMAGAWLVMPFAGLELAVLAAAFHYVNGNASDYESLQVNGDRLVIETRNRKRIERVEFNRYWVRVVLQGLPGGVRQLLLRSTGREVRIGRFLSDEQKMELARELRSVTGLLYR